MRLSAREVAPSVAVMPDSVRPIRLRAGGLTFTMDVAEALGLATQLADAIAEVQSPQALEFFNTRKDQS